MQPVGTAVQQRIEMCLEQFRQGSLTLEDLEQLRDLAAMPPKPQSLLYIQASSTHPGSQALGMMMIVDGKSIEPPDDPKEWPYQSALEAVADGWRILSFPNLALLMNPVVPQGLGCEFILEK